MSDRRFMAVLVSGLAALLGAGLVALATVGLQDPVYRNFDTGAVIDTSRSLTGLLGLGAVIVVAGLGTATAIFRAQLRSRRQ